MARGRASAAIVAVLLLAGAGCSSSDKGNGSTTTVASHGAAEPAGTGHCDDTDPSACLLPWPNDSFTRRDPSTDTGRRLDLPAKGMPANATGTHIDPTEWNRNDGFSPASNLLVHIPDLDVKGSSLPPVTDPESSLASGSNLVLVDTTANKRAAAWAEFDANAADNAKQALIITPIAALTEGHTYAIGLRKLVHTDGSAVKRSAAFARLVDNPTDAQHAWLDALAKSGAPTDDFDIAWSFTVASARSLSSRLQHMVDATLATLGDGAPAFTVDHVENAGAARILRGTFEMPKYLTGDGSTGTVLNNGSSPDGLPKLNGTMRANFTCTMPTAATAQKPAEMIVYGHGLLGSREEVTDIGATAATVNIGMCATDYLGMSRDDVGTVLSEFDDFSRFRTQPDRMLQGQLAFVLLGRLLRSDKGFVTHAAFGNAGQPAIDTTKLTFLGASQGGVLGGAASSMTSDWDNVVLAVGGLGYNLLLRRSADFDQFVGPFEKAYPDELNEVLTIELSEQLWDRGENAAYAQHLTAHPYAGRSAKRVLMLEAFGDHQVANVSTEKLARTLGLERRAPTLAVARSSSPHPFFGIPPLTKLPATSGLFVWDFGTPTPPDSNTPPTEGKDPHGSLGSTPAALALLAGFVNNGTLTDPCGPGPCKG